jgi:electron transfer flavoprotein alpha subunit
MAQVIVLAETRRGAVRDVSLELVSAARGLADEAGAGVTVAVVGADAVSHVVALSVTGVDRIVTVTSQNEHFDAGVSAAALRALVERERPIAVLAAHSVDSMSFVPAVAAVLQTGFASDVLALGWQDEVTVRRGSYSDKLVAELDFPGKDTVIAMVRPGAFVANPQPGATPEILSADELAGGPSTQHLGFREPESAGVDITAADLLLSIGRGIEEEENVARFEALAESMGASLSVSRPLVDAGWATSSRQVGQSGKTVRPKVYLALGISGAVQHLAGIREAETIIAVNKDPGAPIFAVAHYGVVADLFDIADELEHQFPG